MKARYAMLVVLAVLVAACGTKQASMPSVTPGSPRASSPITTPSSIASQAPTGQASPCSVSVTPPGTPAAPATAVYMVEFGPDYFVASGAGASPSAECTAVDALHVVTVINGVATDRTIYRSNQHRQLLAASKTLAIEIDGAQSDGNDVGNDTVNMVDLETGASHSLGTMAALGIPNGGFQAGVMRPDGSEVAIGSSHKLVVLQLPSGAERILADTGVPTIWFVPFRWTSAGLYVAEAGGLGAKYLRLFLVNPATGSLAVVSPDNPQLVVSPNGGWIATSATLASGNTLTLTHIGVNSSTIMTTTGELVPRDVTDDGQVLFSSETPSWTDPVTPDMGLYLGANGHAVQQLSESSYGEFGTPDYGAASFVDPTTALVAQMRGGYLAETSLDVELVQLCADTSSGCSVAITSLSSTPTPPGDTTVTERFLMLS